MRRKGKKKSMGRRQQTVCGLAGRKGLLKVHQWSRRKIVDSVKMTLCRLQIECWHRVRAFLVLSSGPSPPVSPLLPSAKQLVLGHLPKSSPLHIPPPGNVSFYDTWSLLKFLAICLILYISTGSYQFLKLERGRWTTQGLNAGIRHDLPNESRYEPLSFVNLYSQFSESNFISYFS